MLHCVLKAAKYKKQQLVCRHFKYSDDIFDTKTLNLADVSSLDVSPSVVNLLLHVVKSGSTLSNNFWLCHA